MELLIIGGTVFLGRHLVAAARAAGHHVTLFNRGRSAPDAIPDVEQIHGDRDGGLDPLRGRAFDAVIDTCGYVPRVVRDSAELLEPSTAHYTFVSSVSVYASFDVAPVGEDQPVATLDDHGTEQVTNETYGPLKAACEDVVRDVYGARALIVRPGLIVGPFDPTDRFTYWPRRVARGGTVLAPGAPDALVQFIDARDLAEWIVRAIEVRASGVYNATGPDHPLTLGDVIETCINELNPEAHVEWVDERFLLERSVAPWMGLPLWLPAGEAPGLQHIDISRALAAGLRFRDVATTVRDTHAWDAPRDHSRPRAGISVERELELLDEWRAAQGHHSQ